MDPDAAAAPAQEPSATFEVGEPVKAYWHGYLYNAIITEIMDHCVAGGQLTGAIRVDNWKFIIDYNYSNYPVPTTQEPFLERYNTTDITDHLVNGSLFDLAADPNERADLANAHPELAATMRKKLMEHYAGSTECYMCPPAGMKAFDVWNAKESFIGPWEADADSMYSCRT